MKYAGNNCSFNRAQKLRPLLSLDGLAAAMICELKPANSNVCIVKTQSVT